MDVSTLYIRFFTFTLTRTPLDIVSPSFDYLARDNDPPSCRHRRNPGMDWRISHPSHSLDNHTSRNANISVYAVCAPPLLYCHFRCQPTPTASHLQYHPTLKPPRRVDTSIAAGTGTGTAAPGKFFFLFFFFCFYTILMSIHRQSRPTSGDDWGGSRGRWAGAGDASTRRVSSPLACFFFLLAFY
jgi:hypothetical protein